MTFDNPMGVVSLPFMQVDGGSGGGSGASGSAGSGAGGGSNTGNTGSAGAGGSGSVTGGYSHPSGQGPSQGGGTPSATPEPLEWDDNRQFRFKGQDKPISAKDYVRGFQSQMTKASQEAARLKKELATRDERIKQFESVAGGRNVDPNAHAGEQFLGEITQAPFISGQMMGTILQDLQQGVRERDTVQLAVLRKIAGIEQVLGQLHGVNQQQGHETKLKSWLQEGGYPDEAFELADIIYRGYEGDNLDEEFPQIFASRWKQMQTAIARQNTRERERARQLPWVPGKGGNTGPGGGKNWSKASPKELADAFFPGNGNNS